MRRIAFALPLAAFLFLSCNKQDTATRIEHYAQVSYRIESNDSNLTVNFIRAKEIDGKPWNVTIGDSIIANPGTYLIPATILTGEAIFLYGYSERGGDFSLQITEPSGKILAQTNGIPLDSANALHPNRWYAKIWATP